MKGGKGVYYDYRGELLSPLNEASEEEREPVHGKRKRAAPERDKREFFPFSCCSQKMERTDERVDGPKKL